MVEQKENANGQSPDKTNEPSGQMRQSDQAAQNIHNAFILGWSLVELRSRIQVVDLDEDKLPSMAKKGDQQKRSFTADPVDLVTYKNEQLLCASRMRTAYNTIVRLQRDTFPASITIGTLYDPPREDELPYLYAPAPDLANINPPLDPTTVLEKFPGPPYAMSGIQPLKEKSGKQVECDFRLFEMTRRAINCLTLLLVTPEDSLVPDDVKKWQDDLTREIVKAAKKEQQKVADDPSMMPSLTAKAYQSCNAYQGQANEENEGQPVTSSSPASPGPKVAKHALRSPQGEAIHLLSVLIARLLQAWDGYLRERITAEGVGSNNLVILLAYEAGRNLASLSWDTSVNTIPVVNKKSNHFNDDLYQEWHKTFTDSNVVHVLNQITAMSSILDDSYDRSNTKPPAPAVADSAKDDLLVRPDPALPSQVLYTVRQSIEYWQRAILWLDMPVKKDDKPVLALDKDGKPVLVLDKNGKPVLALDKVGKFVLAFNKDGKPVTVFDPNGQPILLKDKDGKPAIILNRHGMVLEDWQLLRKALIQQSGIWFNLVTGQQDVRGFTVQNVAHQILDDALDEFREIAQRDLPAAAEQAVRDIGGVLDSARQSVLDISEMAIKTINDVFGGYWRWILVAFIVSGVCLIAYMVYTQKTDVVLGFITSAVTAVLSYLGIRRGNTSGSQSQANINQAIKDETSAQTGNIDTKKKDIQEKNEGGGISLAGLAGGAVQQAGNFLLNAYDRGFQRIQIELQSLNFSVAVAHPLIEYFVLHDGIDVHGDYEFLTKVIWSNASREQQLRRVITAAFGPISILLAPSKKQEAKEKNASSSSSTQDADEKSSSPSSE